MLLANYKWIEAINCVECHGNLSEYLVLRDADPLTVSYFDISIIFRTDNYYIFPIFVIVFSIKVGVLQVNLPSPEEAEFLFFYYLFHCVNVFCYFSVSAENGLSEAS